MNHTIRTEQEALAFLTNEQLFTVARQHGFIPEAYTGKYGLQALIADIAHQRVNGAHWRKES